MVLPLADGIDHCRTGVSIHLRSGAQGRGPAAPAHILLPYRRPPHQPESQYTSISPCVPLRAQVPSACAVACKLSRVIGADAVLLETAAKMLQRQFEAGTAARIRGYKHLSRQDQTRAARLGTCAAVGAVVATTPCAEALRLRRPEDGCDAVMTGVGGGSVLHMPSARFCTGYAGCRISAAPLAHFDV